MTPPLVNTIYKSSDESQGSSIQIINLIISVEGILWSLIQPILVQIRPFISTNRSTLINTTFSISGLIKGTVDEIKIDPWFYRMLFLIDMGTFEIFVWLNRKEKWNYEVLVLKKWSLFVVVNFALLKLGIRPYLHNCYSDSRLVDTFINWKSHLEKGEIISNYVYIAFM